MGNSSKHRRRIFMSCILSTQADTVSRHATRVTKPNVNLSSTRNERRLIYKYVDGLRVSDHAMFDLQIR